VRGLISFVNRIVLVGSGGAGKSTLAIRLGKRLSLPVVHLDEHFWLPGWQRLDVKEQQVVLDRLLDEERWVMDGDHIRTQSQRFSRADTVVFIDYPRYRCLSRVVGRALKHRGRNRPGMNAGCQERVNWALLRWVWRYKVVERPQVLANIEAFSGRTRIVVLRNDGEVERFLKEVGAPR